MCQMKLSIILEMDYSTCYSDEADKTYIIKKQ